MTASSSKIDVSATMFMFIFGCQRVRCFCGFHCCDVNRSFRGNIVRFRFARKIYIRAYINTYVQIHTYITHICILHTYKDRHAETQKLRSCWSQNSNFPLTEENLIKRNIPKNGITASNISKSVLNRRLNSSK
jgi:hypothetical protein